MPFLYNYSNFFLRERHDRHNGNHAPSARMKLSSASRKHLGTAHGSRWETTVACGINSSMMGKVHFQTNTVVRLERHNLSKMYSPTAVTMNLWIEKATWSASMFAMSQFVSRFTASAGALNKVPI